MVMPFLYDTNISIQTDLRHYSPNPPDRGYDRWDVDTTSQSDGRLQIERPKRRPVAIVKQVSAHT